MEEKEIKLCDLLSLFDHDGKYNDIMLMDSIEYNSKDYYSHQYEGLIKDIPWTYMNATVKGMRMVNRIDKPNRLEVCIEGFELFQ